MLCHLAITLCTSVNLESQTMLMNYSRQY